MYLQYIIYFFSVCYRGHDDEVLDVAFDYTGERIVTASSDGMLLPVCSLRKNARVFCVTQRFLIQSSVYFGVLHGI